MLLLISCFGHRLSFSVSLHTCSVCVFLTLLSWICHELLLIWWVTIHAVCFIHTLLFICIFIYLFVCSFFPFVWWEQSHPMAMTQSWWDHTDKWGAYEELISLVVEGPAMACTQPFCTGASVGKSVWLSFIYILINIRMIFCMLLLTPFYIWVDVMK